MNPFNNRAIVTPYNDPLINYENITDIENANNGSVHYATVHHNEIDPELLIRYTMAKYIRWFVYMDLFFLLLTLFQNILTIPFAALVICGYYSTKKYKWKLMIPYILYICIMIGFRIYFLKTQNINIAAKFLDVITILLSLGILWFIFQFIRLMKISTEEQLLRLRNGWKPRRITITIR